MLEKFSQTSVTIGTESFQLYSFKDVYSEFTHHLDHGDGFEEPPLYGILWPSAEALAWSLWQNHRTQLRGKRVLEVGCGLGLPSLLCSRLGAEVTAMDNHKNFAEVFQQNLDANGLRCHTATGSFADKSLTLGSFDLIIGSDILYEPDNYAGLERFIIDHASAGGEVLIADPGRYAAGKFGEKWKSQENFQQQTYSLKSEQIIDLYSFRFQG